MSLTHGRLHAAILQNIVDHGVAPELEALSARLGAPHEAVIEALRSWLP